MRVSPRRHPEAEEQTCREQTSDGNKLGVDGPGKQGRQAGRRQAHPEEKKREEAEDED